MKVSGCHNNCIRCRTKRGDVNTNEVLCRKCFESIMFQEDRNEIARLKGLLVRIYNAKEMNDAESQAWIDLGKMFKDENHN